LAEKCGHPLWFTKKAEEVLDKTLECAINVHEQYVVHENADNVQKGCLSIKEGHVKERHAEEDYIKWKELDAKFEVAIRAITQEVEKKEEEPDNEDIEIMSLNKNFDKNEDVPTKTYVY
jgi:hypothetical protein